MESIFLHPFALGLYLGLIVGFVLWFKQWLTTRTFKNDNNVLRQHLHTQMEINATGNSSVRDELNNLCKQNENLRITVATLQSRPHWAEIRQMRMYDKAIHLLYERSPGFAPVWENVVEEAEEYIRETDTGIKPLMRKIFRFILPASSAVLPKSVAESAQPESDKTV